MLQAPQSLPPTLSDKPGEPGSARSLRVMQIGNLGNNAYNTSVLLRRLGIDVQLFLRPGEWQPSREEGKPIHETWIKNVDSPAWLSTLPYRMSKVIRRLYFMRVALYLRRCDVIHSWTGALMSLWRGEELAIAWKRPWVATATGSDLRELAAEDSPAGQRMREHFQKAAVVTIAPDQGHYEMAYKLGLTDVRYHRLPLDTDKYRPMDLPRLLPEAPLIFLVASSLDWKINDPGEWRYGKATDRFFRAFARWVREGGKAKLAVIRWGIDAEPAERLVGELGLTDHIVWLEPVDNKPQLIALYNRCDVVVDQFEVGSFGWVSLEAMACARPTMVYLWDQGQLEAYGEKAPVFNCQTEDEIYTQIVRANSPQERTEIGRKARDFILRHHSPEVAIHEFIQVYKQALDLKERGEWPPSR